MVKKMEKKVVQISPSIFIYQDTFDYIKSEIKKSISSDINKQSYKIARGE